MERVLGVGGIFFKAKDPALLKAWYREHLGLPTDEHGETTFVTEGDPGPCLVWSPFSSGHQVLRAEPSSVHDQLSRQRSARDARTTARRGCNGRRQGDGRIVREVRLGNGSRRQPYRAVGTTGLRGWAQRLHVDNRLPPTTARATPVTVRPFSSHAKSSRPSGRARGVAKGERRASLGARSRPLGHVSCRAFASRVANVGFGS